jgi:hypothetical protein
MILKSATLVLFFSLMSLFVLWEGGYLRTYFSANNTVLGSSNGGAISQAELDTMTNTPIVNDSILKIMSSSKSAIMTPNDFKIMSSSKSAIMAPNDFKMMSSSKSAIFSEGIPSFKINANSRTKSAAEIQLEQQIKDAAVVSKQEEVPTVKPSNQLQINRILTKRAPEKALSVWKIMLGTSIFALVSFVFWKKYKKKVR